MEMSLTSNTSIHDRGNKLVSEHFNTSNLLDKNYVNKYQSKLNVRIGYNNNHANLNK